MEDSVLLKDQVPKIIAQVLRSVKAAQEAGMPVRLPEYIAFEAVIGKIKIDFDVWMENPPGGNGHVEEGTMGVDFATQPSVTYSLPPIPIHNPPEK